MNAGREDPVAVATEETGSFLEAWLPPAPARILEVGCGNGEVAMRLQERGYAVTALDSDPEAVDRAREGGVNARLCEWPMCEERGAHAVVFSRSLHHIRPLEEAVAQAARALAPDGIVLVEDFACSDCPDAAIRWFHGELRQLPSRGIWRDGGESLCRNLLRDAGDPSVWRSSHHHGLHPAGAMESMLRRQFTLRHAEVAPYFYRYLISEVEPGMEGCRLVRDLLSHERAAISAEGLFALGRRWVGVLRSE